MRYSFLIGPALAALAFVPLPASAGPMHAAPPALTDGSASLTEVKWKGGPGRGHKVRMGDRGRHLGWERGRHRGWERERGWERQGYSPSRPRYYRD